MAHFEIEVLTRPANLKTLMDLSGKWIGQVQQRRPIDGIILDLDSSVSETHGQQEGSAYNGYYEFLGMIRTVKSPTLSRMGGMMGSATESEPIVSVTSPNRLP